MIRAALKVPAPRAPSHSYAFTSQCVICLDEFKDGDELVWVACGHSFHHRCIVAWNTKNPACPLCRSKVTTE